MRTVFLDTVGLLASWDSSDQWHDLAMRALDEIGTSARTVTTSPFIVEVECGRSFGHLCGSGGIRRYLCLFGHVVLRTPRKARVKSRPATAAPTLAISASA